METKSFIRFLAIGILFTLPISCGDKNKDKVIPVPDGYSLVWSDEFDDDGPVDENKWGYELGYLRNMEPQDYRKDNAFCKDGKLIIEARMDGGVLTSASIQTKDKASFLYGRIQACIKIPVAESAWPAFWTLGQTRGWPDQGEVDIMEFYRYGQDPVPTILGNGFWVAKNGVDVIDDTGTVPLSQFTDADPQWAEKFHVWTSDWDENQMVIKVDDTVVNTIDLTQTINQGGPHVGENPLRQPHYIKLNLALRGRDNDPVVESALPMRMEVDWVRVYKKSE